LAKLPERAKWKECNITLKEDPAEEHLLQYRNPLDAIQSLWGNPAHTDQLVFQPQKMWSDSSRASRLYNEMWTANWWWKIQVFL
jgi:hypothetical protein